MKNSLISAPGGAIAILYALSPALSSAQHTHVEMEQAGRAMHPLGFGHGRHGSGTSWLPDETPTHHLMGTIGSWTLMGHGALFGGYVKMNGPRGDEIAYAPNMVMVMVERDAGSRTFLRFSGMFSADAATVGGAGYPLLLQTGETWNGAPLKDHQHPHNVFSELSVDAVHALGERVAFSVYVAPVGEPALGPPAYVHRPVGLNNPLAPIGHHWQDATHISFGVVTAGLQTRAWQVEVSTLNGREPGENRAEILPPEFDSVSGRVSVNPAPSLALQASHGYLRSPEAEHPEHDAWRTSASAVWAGHSSGDRVLDAALVWGRNRTEGQNLDSWLLEGEWGRERAGIAFTRLEYVEKSAEELVLPTSYGPNRLFPLRQATLGLVYALPLGGALSWGIGGQVVLSAVPDDLGPVYGDGPGGWTAFLRVRPRRAGHD